MKLKRFLSALLASVMLVSSVDISSFTSKAENDYPIQSESSARDDMEVTSTNSFGGLLADKLQSEQEADDNYDAAVSGIEVNGNIATVSYSTTADCKLIVAVLSEDDESLITSASALVCSQLGEADVEFPIATMPEYYYIKAFLVEPDTLAPVSKEYVDSFHTKDMQDLLAMTTDDFEPERVLNLDDDNTNNFAVYSEDTVVVSSDEEHNTVISSDDENGVYVFSNADESLTSLEAGDKFACTDEEDNTVIALVETVEVDGDNVTITSDDTQLEDIFDYVKIEAGQEDFEYSHGGIEPNPDYFESYDDAQTDVFGPVNKQKPIDIETTIGERSIEVDLGKLQILKNSKWDINLNGTLEVSNGVEVKVYVTRKTQYLKVVLDTKLELAAELEIKFKHPIKLLEIPIEADLYGLEIFAKPAVIVEVTGKIELKGTFELELGVEFSNKNGFHFIKPDKFSDINKGIELSGSAELFIGLEIPVGVAVITDKLASGDVTLKGGVVVKVKVKPNSNLVEHNCKLCLDITVSLKSSMESKLQFLSLKRLTFKKKIFESEIKLGKYYYSIDHHDFGEGTCPYVQQDYQLTVKTELGYVVPDATVAVKMQLTPLVKLVTNKLNSKNIVTEVENGVKVQYYVFRYKTDKNGIAYINLPAGTYEVEVTEGKCDPVEATIVISDFEKKSTVVMRYKDSVRGAVLATTTTTKATTTSTTTTQTTTTTTTTIVSSIDYPEADIFKSSGYSPNYEASPVKPKLFITVDGAVGGKVFDASSIAGKTINCTLDVSGANNAYCDTGIHIYYDSRLEIVKNERGYPATAGSAIEKIDGITKIDPTAPEGMSGFFVTTAGYGNKVGLDGTMWTFQLKVPENAQPGDVYPIDIIYRASESAEDIFVGTWDRDIYGDEAPESIRMMNTYAFTLGIYNARYNPNFKADSHDIAYCPALADIPGYYDGYIAVAGSGASVGTGDDDDDTEYHLHKVSGRSAEAVRLSADYSEPELVTSEFTDLIPNAVYNFYYTLDKHIDGATAAFDADPDRLGFIAQGIADEDGNLSFTYYKPEGGENPAAYVVAAKKGISAAEVSIEDIPYDGEEHIIAPEVTLNGETLIEGVDYELAGNTEAKEAGSYTLIVRGKGNYFGDILIGYAVACDHEFFDGVCTICGHIDPEYYSLGDVNRDGAVNSKDASEVLGEYSRLSTGDGYSLDYTQQIAADIDKNDSINSIDASNILSYYSYLSTGGKESFEQFLAPDKNTA